MSAMGVAWYKRDMSASAGAAHSTEAAIAALEALRSPDGSSGLGWPDALAVPGPPQVEHDLPTGDIARPLLDHALRGLGKLAALERGDASAFAFGADRFARICARLEGVRAA